MSEKRKYDFDQMCLFRRNVLVDAPDAGIYIAVYGQLPARVVIDGNEGVCQFNLSDNQFDLEGRFVFKVPINDERILGYFGTAWTDKGERLDNILRKRGFVEEPRLEGNKR